MIYLVGPRRFIPACAGNRSWFSGRLPKKAVHPRVCGEQGHPRRLFTTWAGSSPRVRGTGRSFNISEFVTWFIPACAGNSLGFRMSLYISTVHPRVCGEQLPALPDGRWPSGSSPRVRGTGESSPSFVLCARFIPACAGNRSKNSAGGIYHPVHPRVCGEQIARFRRRARRPGSSPRVRGTEERFVVKVIIPRFIPACAGNRGVVSSIISGDAVHPRVCGEQHPAPIRRPPWCGSSPRVRGTDLRPGYSISSCRFIPACAGNRGYHLRS